MSKKLKYNNYPIIDDNNKCLGLLRLTDLDNVNKKKVILVDHNESSQSVMGLSQAEIVEIVDHHKIGDLTTNNPINFRNMAVGSTNTIIYQLYKEKDIDTEAAETATNVSLSVVQYLNQQAGTRHRVTEDVVDQVEDLITAGYSEADIRTVIDKKSAEWKNDDRMRPNLRPSVLFGAKFPEYYGALDTGQAAADREEAERKKRARKAREEQAAREAALEAEYEAGQKRLSPEEVQARLAAISKKTFN